MEIENYNYTGTMMPYDMEYQRIEPTSIDIGASVFDVRNFDGVRATGERKRILDNITENNPDGVISDELEAYIYQNLMTDEEAVKMPDSGDINGNGIIRFSEDGYRNIVYQFDENGARLSAYGSKYGGDESQDSYTCLFDKNKDDYADSVYMLAQGRELDIDLPEKEWRSLRWEIGMPVSDIANFKEGKAAGEKKELLDYMVNNDPDCVVSDEIEAYIYQCLINGEQQIKMPNDDDSEKSEGLKISEDVARSISCEEYETSSRIYAMSFHGNGDNKWTSWTYLNDTDKDGNADTALIYSAGSNVKRKQVNLDFNDNKNNYIMDIEQKLIFRFNN